MSEELLRLPAEQLFQKEIDALIAAEKNPVPTGWRMSPQSVKTYICGGKVGKTVITPKYIGHERLVEIAISTLVTDRALLLIGEPGTAKSWLSEHLTVAINGDSTKVIQGTAGTTEEQIKYSWNYAMLIAQGPSHEAMLKSPVFNAMETGTIALCRGDFALCFRGAGRADFRFVRKENFRAGACSGGRGEKGIFRDCDSEHKGQGRQ